MGNDAAERTEHATPRKRDKERKKGNVSKSQDLTSAILITAGFGFLTLFSAYFFHEFKNIFYQTFTSINPQQINTEDIYLIIMPYVQTLLYTIVPFLLLLTIVAAAAVRFQVGQIFATDKIKLSFDKLAPSHALKNAKKLFSPAEPRTWMEFVKSLLKLMIVAMTGFSVISARRDELIGLLGFDLQTGFAVLGSVLFEMVVKICIALLVLGIIDKKYQDYEYDKSMKMTKQEIKDEMKDSEGDPKIKARVRSIQMQMAQQRMMAAIPSADVVVTNPTHYAVAIKYDRGQAPAPMVVAKGVDFVAFKIREIAQNNNIPIVENRPLAQALYKLVPIDGIIPSDMFVAVAEVLAYVYNRNKK